MEVPDAFRSEPINRLSPSSPFYHFTLIFEDGDRYRALDVIVDDSTAAYGALRVVFAYCP